ncbi:MAG: permease [Halanaerobiaceae bacterium]
MPTRKNYNNFDVAIYVTAPGIDRINVENMEQEFAFFEKYIKVDKVYLETFRKNITIPRDKMIKIKQFFNDKGIKTSGGITTTIKDSEKDNRFMNAVCYTDSDMRLKIKEVAEYTASLFDEFILDDFYFTNCTCPSCIEAKGDKSWPDFRLDLMAEVSENIIINPAREVNPDVDIIIKYPNWIESFQHAGYNTEVQPDLFDKLYTGTETRNTAFTHQHLPRYASYSLMRWVENIKPGYNGGGWFDWIDCIHNIGSYLEQAYLTVFSGTKELMLFCFSGLKDSVFVPALGHELKKLDNISGELKDPVGIPVYEPHHASGEDHLYDYLGMTGLAFEPTPDFPGADSLIVVTANSAADSNIITRLKKHLMNGGDAVITSGFLKRMKGAGIEELTTVKYTDKKANVKKYAMDTLHCAYSEYIDGSQDILFPVLNYKNNSTWPLIVGVNNENTFPVLLQDYYGKGKIYTLTIPDNYGDLYNLPEVVLTKIRYYFMQDFDLYLEAEAKIGLFAYDNDSFIVESFLPYHRTARVHFRNTGVKLFSENGEEIKNKVIREGETIFDIELPPSSYKFFKYRAK